MIGIIGLQRRQLIGYLHNCPYINNKTRPHTYTPENTLPLFGLESEFRGGIFVVDYREFFQTNNKSNRQMMSVFIYSSSNL